MSAVTPEIDSGQAGISPGLRLRRRLYALNGWVWTGLAFAALAGVVLFIVGFVLVRGGEALQPKLFTTSTTGIAGGLLNAITGSLLVSGFALVFAIPVGIAAGIYLVEYPGWFARIGRFLTDLLVGVPSIVLGLFGFIAIVGYAGTGFSVLAGGLTLGMFVLPYIARGTELALSQLPGTLRESAYALGAPESTVILKVLVPAARAPIINSILLAFAIGLGETAMLIYTVNWSDYVWNGRLTHEPLGYLTYVIWSFIQEPYPSAHRLAYAAALLVTAMVFLLSLASRLLLHWSARARR